MAEEKKRVDAKFTEACFLMDYIDIISEASRHKSIKKGLKISKL